MNVTIDYAERPSGYDPNTYQFSSGLKPLRVWIHSDPKNGVEPRVMVMGEGWAGKKLDLEMTLAEFRTILAAVVASGTFPGLSRDDLATASRVIATCLDAIPEPRRAREE
jgi:hypothetical protein